MPSTKQRVCTRFTDEQISAIKKESESAGISISEYMRRRTLGLKVMSKTDLLLLNELRRTGGLVRHIFLENKNFPYGTETRQILLDVQDAIKKITGSIDIGNDMNSGDEYEH